MEGGGGIEASFIFQFLFQYRSHNLLVKHSLSEIEVLQHSRILNEIQQIILTFLRNHILIV